MTIQELLDRVDLMKPNHFSEEQKIRWLSELEGRVVNEIIMTHENGHHHHDGHPGHPHGHVDIHTIEAAPVEPGQNPYVRLFHGHLVLGIPSGADGKTPVRGIDYLTPHDLDEMRVALRDEILFDQEKVATDEEVDHYLDPGLSDGGDIGDVDIIGPDDIELVE